MKTPLLITSLILSTSLANAATVVTVARGGNGDQANFAANSGQTFTTSVLGTDTFLSTIDLVGPNTTAVAEPLGPFTVKLWTDIDGNAETWDPGAQVAASSNLVTILGGNQAFTANFSGETLADNTVYLLSFTSGTTDHAAFRMGLSAPGGNGPLGSTGKLINNTGTPTFGDNRELAFTVTTTAVPEPSSTALLGLGGLALLLRRRK